MVRAFLPRAVLLLALTLLLAAPLQAGGLLPAGKLPTDPATKGILAPVWDFLTRGWASGGCDIDPDGRCAPRPNPTLQIDSGCDIDPSGRCSR